MNWLMRMPLEQCRLSIHGGENNAYLGRRFEFSILGPNCIRRNLFRAPFFVQVFDSVTAKSLFRFVYKHNVVLAHLVVLLVLPTPSRSEIIEQSRGRIGVPQTMEHSLEDLFCSLE